ncbi:serine hydrolase [Soonwooa sp.]|uniref:serine hydrolase n=1 Tax=Soonwooa sp. TaxID=1938592 RepID=UPI0026310945|nr:serine hydrolase [Soonwooa sp.]
MQNLQNKISKLENDLFHWDKSKNKQWSLQERMAHFGVNAVSIAVVKDFKIEWAKAYGYADLAEKRLATSETLFQAASISKSLNSLALLKLVQDGKIRLNEDINNYLKTWKFHYNTISKGQKITLSNLLNHTAGLSVGGFMGYEKGDNLPTIQQILNGESPANSKPVKSIFEPNLKYEYSGGGTTVSQLILEDVTREKYENFLQKNVLNTLEMLSSSFNQPPKIEQESELATGYIYENEIKGKYHVYPEKAAAGLWTTPTDLAKFVIEIQCSLLGKSNKVLSKELTNQILNNNWGVFESKFVGEAYFEHSGGNEGFVSYYTGSRLNGDAIVVMTNGMSGQLIDEIVKSIANLNQWENFPLEPIKESIALAIRKTAVQDVDKGIELYKDLKRNQSEIYNFSDEDELNSLGYELLNMKNFDAAIRIFELNISNFPTSPNAYEGRGEACFSKKEYSSAQNDYLKVLHLVPYNQDAKDMLLKINEILKS